MSQNSHELDIHRDTVSKYLKQPEEPCGIYAQVDFGERYMDVKNGNKTKVYFFAMVLSRSCQKFVYLSDRTFTNANAIL